MPFPSGFGQGPSRAVAERRKHPRVSVESDGLAALLVPCAPEPATYEAAVLERAVSGERACLACEGRGYFPLGYPNLKPPQCKACWQVAGRIVERIPASDAIADAETFYDGVWGENSRTKVARWTRDALKDSGIHARSITAWIGYDDEQAIQAAELAASAAFRAVPGLRA